ncbi:MAG: hypothetical protein PVF87_00450 [Acidimicrobiia bacterium]|jgi:hypothetical protein
MRAEPGRHRAWTVYVLGALAGAALGVIVALNVMIFSGVERGYEAGLGEVFAHSPLAGVLVVASLIAGPVVGVIWARWTRRSN